MNEPSPAKSVLRLFLWLISPVLAVMLWLIWVVETPTDGSFIRFVNAMLTSFTLVSFMLLLTLVVYGDARKRPVSPLFGMLALCLCWRRINRVLPLTRGSVDGSQRFGSGPSAVEHHPLCNHGVGRGGRRDDRRRYPLFLPSQLAPEDDFLRRGVKGRRRTLAVDFIRGRSVGRLFR